MPRLHGQSPHLRGRGHGGGQAGGAPVLHLGVRHSGQGYYEDQLTQIILQGAPSVYTDIAAIRDWVDFILSKYQD